MDPHVIDRLLGELASPSEEAAPASPRGVEATLDRAQWLADILAHSPDFICIMDLDGKLLYLSRAIPGKDPASYVGLDPASLMPPGHREVWHAAIVRAQVTGEPQTVQIQSVGDLWWETRIAPIRRDGRITCLLSIGSDITERRRTERALAQAEQERDLALAASGMGQWRWNVASDQMTWDGATKRIFGWPADRDDITYAKFLACVHPEDRQRVHEHSQRTLAAPRTSDLDCRVVRPDGQVRWILVKGKVLFGSEGKPTEVLGGVFDNTDNKQIEAGQRRLQKLEAIGQLAGGVAHDFNNLLLAIMGNVDMAKRAQSGRRELMLDEALIACNRAAELTKQLLAFGRQQSLPDTPADINEVVSDTLKLLRRLIPENIEVELVAAADLPRVLADRGQLEQVVMNLCLNARDAMPGGGKLLLRTTTELVTGGFRETHPWARAGRYVLLTVSDNGVGISPSDTDRVFDPFFTTKKQGTGLGLATVYGIVKRHCGLVHLHSEPGKGTTFKVHLPVSEGLASAVGDKIEDPAQGGPETILVAEDEAPVRAVVVRILSQAGYRVLTANDGAHAVEVFRAHADSVDLILMDAVMPRRSGAEALVETRAIAPDVRVVMSSGYAENLGSAATGLDVEFLAKPYEPDALLRVIRRVLDERKGGGS
jgi:two-component system cell cycle sensor histidine kinase/response regulator CckA